jgi:hypothetical protein
VIVISPDGARWSSRPASVCLGEHVVPWFGSVLADHLIRCRTHVWVRPVAVPLGRADAEPALFKINIRPSKSKHLSLTKPESAIRLSDATRHPQVRTGAGAARSKSPARASVGEPPTQHGLVLGHVDQYLSDCAVLDGLVCVSCISDREPVQRQAGAFTDQQCSVR